MLPLSSSTPLLVNVSCPRVVAFVVRVAFFVLLFLLFRCSGPVPCDERCQQKIFPCFQQLRTCDSICALPSGQTIKCIESAEKGDKIDASTLSSADCEECRGAFGLWKQGKDCDSGQVRCTLKLTSTGLHGYLLQKCVLIQERWTWSDGRLCDTQDTFPCLNVDGQTHCLGCGTDADCAQGERCDVTRRQCVACSSSTECPALLPQCSSSGRCVKCTEDSHCRPSLSGEYCINSRCVCEQHTDCHAAGFSACNTTTQTCTPCKADADCSLDVFGMSKCSLGRCTSTCQKDTDCATLNNGICVSGRCLPGCQTDQDCQILQFKFCENRRCTQCLKHTDCPAAKPFCHPQHRTCTACTQHTDCPKIRPICDPTLWYCRR